MWRVVGALVWAACIAGCGAPRDVENACRARLAEPRAIAPRLRNLVLITVDGVRAEDVLGEGARAGLPNLYRVIDGGVALASIAASGPNFVSLPGYREIFTGRRAGGCQSNECGPLDEPTLLDELRAELPAGDVAAIASWETLERAAAITPRAIAISTGRHGGAGRERLRVGGDASARLDAGAAAGA